MAIDPHEFDQKLTKLLKHGGDDSHRDFEGERRDDLHNALKYGMFFGPDQLINLHESEPFGEYKEVLRQLSPEQEELLRRAHHWKVNKDEADWEWKEQERLRRQHENW